MKFKNSSKLLDTINRPTNREPEHIQCSVSECSQIYDAPDSKNLSNTISRNLTKQQPPKATSV